MDVQRDKTRSLLRRALLLYVIGCPGSGKGTLCKLLEKHYNCYHISVGDVLRTLRDEEDYQSTAIASFIQAGTLIPTADMVDILTSTIKKEPGGHHAIIVDGFPRRLDQGIAAEDQIGKPDLVLFFDCEKPIAMERYLTRNLEGRLDDNEAMFHRRYTEFESLNPAVAKYYQNLGTLIKVGTNDETRISYQRLTTALESDKRWVSGGAVVG